MCMVIALDAYYRQQMPQWNTEKSWPRVMRPNKRSYVDHPEEIDENDATFLDDAPMMSEPSWVGDRRAGRSRIAHQVHILTCAITISPQHLRETRRLLSPDHFKVFDYNDVPVVSKKGCGTFWSEVKRTLNTKKDVVVLGTYGRLISDVKGVPEPPVTESPRDMNNVLTIDVPRGFFFVDEAALVRNPSTVRHFALRRLAQLASYVVGATATPIVSSGMDILNIVRCLESTKVVKRSDFSKSTPLRTMPSDGRRDLVDDRKECFDDCLPEIAGLAELWKSLVGQKTTVLRTLRTSERKEHKQAIKAAQTDEERAAAESNLLLSRTAQKLDGEAACFKEPTFRPDQSQLKSDWDLSTGRMEKEFLGPVRARKRGIIIRRTHTSLGHDGLPLTEVKPVKFEKVWVKMSRKEKKKYDAFVQSLDNTDRRYVVLQRCYLREHYATVTSFWSPAVAPPSAIAVLADMLEEILRKDADLPVERQRKVVVYSRWRSLHPCIQTHLAKRGIFTVSLHGLHRPGERDDIVGAFTRHEDQEVDPIIEVIKRNCYRKFSPPYAHRRAW